MLQVPKGAAAPPPPAVEPCTEAELKLCDILATEFVASGVAVDELLSDARRIADEAKGEAEAKAAASADLMGMF